jgi:hypothetical protein
VKNDYETEEEAWALNGQEEPFKKKRKLEVSCQLHSPAALYPRKEHHVTIGWV